MDHNLDIHNVDYPVAVEVIRRLHQLQRVEVRKPRRKPSGRSQQDCRQVRNRSGQDPLNFPIKLNNKIAALGASIEHGDAKPTAPSYDVYKLLNGKLAEQQSKLDELLKSTLPAVNKQLTDRSLKELVPTKTETPAPRPGAGLGGQ